MWIKMLWCQQDTGILFVGHRELKQKWWAGFSSPCLQYICLSKKEIAGARRHARLVSKKSLSVSHTVGKLFQNSSSWKEDPPIMLPSSMALGFLASTRKIRPGLGFKCGYLTFHCLFKACFSSSLCHQWWHWALCSLRSPGSRKSDHGKGRAR